MKHKLNQLDSNGGAYKVSARSPRSSTPLNSHNHPPKSPNPTISGSPEKSDSFPAISQNPLFVLFLISLVVPLMISAAARKEAFEGGWKPIEDPKDSHVKEIAEFAVAQYNNQTKSDLKLQGVVKGETQVVAGMNFRLVLAITDVKTTKNYEAVVWEKPWENFKKLISFKPV